MYSLSPVSFRAVSENVLRDGASRVSARRFVAVHRRHVRGATGEMNVGLLIVLLLVVMISGSMGLVGPVMLTCGDHLAR